MVQDFVQVLQRAWNKLGNPDSFPWSTLSGGTLPQRRERKPLAVLFGRVDGPKLRLFHYPKIDLNPGVVDFPGV